MDTIKLTPEDSGNLEQIAISIQNIEKILKRIERGALKNENPNMTNKTKELLNDLNSILFLKELNVTQKEALSLAMSLLSSAESALKETLQNITDRAEHIIKTFPSEQRAMRIDELEGARKIIETIFKEKPRSY